ncbi:MAG TPA: hypothetical protein VFA72_01980 [Burkholderiales bacterium]|nr:hypothetical protein [Burkholderiales bacterium]
MLGKAAVAIWCDVAHDVRRDFDHWHAHEHMPERLAIPGFLRGSRWVAERGEGYFILYEVQSEALLSAAPYVERLNNPTPWSRQMMPHHRNMVRGLCRVEASGGAALGQALASVRCAADPARAPELVAWLRGTLLAMPEREGLVAAALLCDIGRSPARETAEQRLRGGDAAPQWIALVSGYSADALAHVVAHELSEANMHAHGAAAGRVAGLYRLAFVLAATGYTGRPEEAA